MTASWHMVMDFSPQFSLLTGPWNYSYDALVNTGECVLAIPTVDMLETVIGVGTTSGSETDKFAAFGLTASPASKVSAPLIGECYANIECRVADYLEKHNIFVLEGVRAWVDRSRKEQTIFHYRGDGTFVADGREFDRRDRMRSKLAPGV